MLWLVVPLKRLLPLSVIIDPDQIRYKRYRFTLTAPITLQSGHSFQDREGILLYYPVRNFYIVSDVAPLPGFSHETVDTVIKEVTEKAPPSPSLQFGLESLELMMSSLIQDRPLGHVLQTRLNLDQKYIVQRDPIKCNVLVLLNNESVEETINQLLSEGTHTIKLKIGYRSYGSERPYLTQLFKRFGHRLRFRLDPNQTWTPKIMHHFFTSLPPSLMDCIDYIEDPVSSIDELRDCYPYFPKIALDHFLKKVYQDQALFRRFPFIIYKPTFNGGFSLLSKLHITSTQNLIISHSFESHIGLYYLNIAAKTLSPTIVHGLNSNYLSEIFF